MSSQYGELRLAHILVTKNMHAFAIFTSLQLALIHSSQKSRLLGEYFPNYGPLLLRNHTHCALLPVVCPSACLSVRRLSKVLREFFCQIVKIRKFKCQIIKKTGPSRQNSACSASNPAWLRAGVDDRRRKLLLVLQTSSRFLSGTARLFIGLCGREQFSSVHVSDFKSGLNN